MMREIRFSWSMIEAGLRAIVYQILVTELQVVASYIVLCISNITDY